jgi:hypothetical protein
MDVRQPLQRSITSDASGRHEQLRRARTFAATSFANAVFAQALLLLAVTLGATAFLANAVSVVLATPTALYLASHYVWKSEDGSQVWSSHLPAFAGLNLAGLGLSTAFIAAATTFFSTPLIINAASAAAWGALWLAKFAVLDQRMCGKAHLK